MPEQRDRSERITDRRLHFLGPPDRDRLIETVARALAVESSLAFAYVFGSFAEGERFHDIDIGLHFGGAPGGENLADPIADRLARLVPFPIDLVVLDQRPTPFRFHVYRGRPLIVRDEEALTTELENTMREYFDIEPVLTRATIEAFGE